ncbi:MAG: transposase, partial [Phycisphaerae bacterium]|nr:transposase [Phycisphaerae bacterium]
MMGPAQRMVPKLFYTQFNLEERIGSDHPLRAVLAAVDFDFVRRQVKHLYGRRGNTSVDPVVLLKLMFLLFYENISSERALMARMPERLDWLWFCGFDLDDELPDHSVLSKARRRWGAALFEQFFGQVLRQCMEA